jgi:hypothetical protein
MNVRQTGTESARKQREIEKLFAEFWRSLPFEVEDACDDGCVYKVSHNEMRVFRASILSALAAEGEVVAEGEVRIIDGEGARRMSEGWVPKVGDLVWTWSEVTASPIASRVDEESNGGWILGTTNGPKWKRQSQFHPTREACIAARIKELREEIERLEGL